MGLIRALGCSRPHFPREAREVGKVDGGREQEGDEGKQEGRQGRVGRRRSGCVCVNKGCLGPHAAATVANIKPSLVSPAHLYTAAQCQPLNRCHGNPKGATAMPALERGTDW